MPRHWIKLALKTAADQIFHYMTIEHSGATDVVVGVDANPVSWGLDINKWDWNPGVGVNSIAAYYDASQNPGAAFPGEWVRATSTWRASSSTST